MKNNIRIFEVAPRDGLQNESSTLGLEEKLTFIKLLVEAGWVDTDGDNIRDKMVNGVKTPFKFKLS